MEEIRRASTELTKQMKQVSRFTENPRASRRVSRASFAERALFRLEASLTIRGSGRWRVKRSGRIEGDRIGGRVEGSPD